MNHNFQTEFDTVFRPRVGEPQQQSIQPWKIENMPWASQVPADPNQLNFQFEAHTSFDERRALLHSKRKSDISTTDATPVKQHISEEKISAHFNGLHISNNNISQNASSLCMEDALMDAPSCNEYRVTAKELEEKLKNANKITICEDLLKIQKEQTKFTLLPEALINRIEKPCTEVVLWQPPPILELLHRKNVEDQRKTSDTCTSSKTPTKTLPEDLIDDIEFSDAEEIDDFGNNNNNTCSVDYNVSQMDEDL